MRDVFRKPLSLLGAAALVLAACASDVSDQPASGEPAPAPVSGVGAAPDALAILESLYPDRGEPPTELVTTEVTEGDGATVTAGQRAIVQYWGLRWSDGGTFAASWTRGEPLSFVLGAGGTISGWDLGVEGMRVGGRRVLVIPPDLAYGDRGSANLIGPGETLVFIVDLLEAGAS